MALKFFLLAALVVAVIAAPQYGPPPPAYEAAPAEAPASYDFTYAVKDEYSGNDFGHAETREGPDTEGSYYVVLPDGRLQKVTYTVNGDSGFVAEVSYEGDAEVAEPQVYAQEYVTEAPAAAYEE